MDKSSHIRGSKDPNTADTNLETPQLYQTIVNIPNEPTLTPTTSIYTNTVQTHTQPPPSKYITTQPQPIQHPSSSVPTQNVKLASIQNVKPESTRNVKLSLDDDKPVLTRLCKICQESDFIEDE